MSSIYNITSDFLQLLEMAQDEEVDQETLKDTLESVQMEFDDKADAYANIMTALSADSNGIEAEIDRLKARKDAIDKNIDNMKRVLEEAMTAVGRPKIKTPTHTFYIGKNAPSVNIIDDSAIPKEFLIPQPDKVDRNEIKKYLKENGNSSWAELVQTESLKIR